MRIIIPIAILILTCYTVEAQKTKMTLTYKDGTTLSGFGRLMGERHIKFRKTKKAKPEKLGFEELNNLDFIKYYSGDEIIIYEFVAIKDSQIKLLERTALGKVSLYKRVRVTGGGYMPMGGTGGLMFIGGGVMKNYYVKRAGEDIATHLGSNQLFTKSFKKAMSDYVKDCPNLVSKIESGELKKKNLIEIIEYYNKKCN